MHVLTDRAIPRISDKRKRECIYVQIFHREYPLTSSTNERKLVALVGGTRWTRVFQ